MRQLGVVFAFDELAAGSCGSGYIVYNHASAAASQEAGYVTNALSRIVQRTADGAVGVLEPMRGHQRAKASPKRC